MGKEMRIKDYGKSPEYILFLVFSLMLGGYYLGRGLATSQALAHLLANKYYLNFIVLGLFGFYVFRKAKAREDKTIFQNWVENILGIIKLAGFNLVSTSVGLVLLGEIFSQVGYASGSLGQEGVDRLAGFLGPALVQGLTGLVFLSGLAMTLAFENFSGTKLVLLILTGFYYANIVWPDLIALPWFIDPIMVMSTYHALDYNIAGPYLMTILNLLGLVLLGNIILLIGKVLRKIQ